MSDGIMFISDSEVGWLGSGRTPFQVIFSDGLFYHYKMAYETAGYIKYDKDGVVVLDPLSRMISALSGSGAKFVIFRLKRGQGEGDLPELVKDFAIGEGVGEKICVNTVYRI